MTQTEQPQHEGTSQPASGRLLWALLGGSLVGIPLGVILSFLATLPFFLGLFFFMLLGLLPGAVVFRMGRPARPIPMRWLWLVGLAVTLITWSTSIAVEYLNFPRTATRQLRQSYRQSMVPQELDTLAEAIDEAIADTLEQYPPGGFIGYVRWSIHDGQLTMKKPIGQGTFTFKKRHRGWKWLLRSLASLVLLGVAIMTQTLGLAEPPRKLEPTPDQRDKLP